MTNIKRDTSHQWVVRFKDGSPQDCIESISWVDPRYGFGMSGPGIASGLVHTNERDEAKARRKAIEWFKENGYQPGRFWPIY